MAEDFYDDYDDLPEPKRRDGLFLWTVFILLLIGVALGCWIGSFYVFGHPEEARSYRLLQKFKKIEPLRRFEVTAAPQGAFLTAQKLFEKYSTYTPLELKQENAELLRFFVKNYAETKKLVQYIRGRFTVIDAYELTSSEMFTHGTVALMQAEEYPQVVVEHIFPTTGSNLAESKRLLTPGYPFNIEKTNDVTAVIHIERLADGRMLFTLMPLHYPSYALKGGAGTFASEPPTDLNIEANLPVLESAQIAKELSAFAKTQTKDSANPNAAAASKSGPELVRLDNVPDGTRAPASGALPEMPVATPIPVRPPVAQRPPATPPTLLTMIKPEIPVARAVPVDPRDTPPLAPPVPAPVTTAAPPLPTMSPQGVPLKPFVKSNAQPGLPPETGANWRTFPAGQLPPGRAITPAEITAFADRGDLGERLYLSGSFAVKASGDYKAVLRPVGGDLPEAGAGSVRIIADFPTGSVLPEEGATVARDAARGFQVVDVRRGADGTINVFVREIIQP